MCMHQMQQRATLASIAMAFIAVLAASGRLSLGTLGWILGSFVAVQVTAAVSFVCYCAWRTRRQRVLRDRAIPRARVRSSRLRR